jgi:hypothetical protein
MLIIHNWYTDEVFTAFELGENDRLTLPQRRLRCEAGLKRLYDPTLGTKRVVRICYDMEVWGAKWHPAADRFVKSVGGGQVVDLYEGLIVPPRRFGPSWQAHAELRQEKLDQHPAQLALLSVGMMDSRELSEALGVTQAAASQRISRHPEAVRYGHKWLMPEHVWREIVS